MNRENKSRRTEIKLGLSVLAVLFVCLIGVVVVKFNGSGELPAVQISSSPGDATEMTSPHLESTHSLSSGPAQPTILANEDATSDAKASGRLSKWSAGSRRYQASGIDAAANREKKAGRSFVAETSYREPSKNIIHEASAIGTTDGGNAADTDRRSFDKEKNIAPMTFRPTSAEKQVPNRQVSRYSGELNSEQQPAQTSQNGHDANPSVEQLPTDAMRQATPRPFETAIRPSPVAQSSAAQSSSQFSRAIEPDPVRQTTAPLQKLVQHQQTAPRPAMRNTGKTVVQPGDSMWTVSRRVYGSGAFFKAIQERNRQRFPNAHDLKIGDEVLTPELAVLRKKYPGLCPRQRTRRPGESKIAVVNRRAQAGGRTYVIEEGDTLYDIARYELGSGSRWPDIYDLNRQQLGVDFDYLRPGIKLTLPADPDQTQQDAVTRLPGQFPR